jgi:hypothetical protein
MPRLRAYLLVLCFGLLLGLRFGSVHLHLCFDGQEPATAVHVADAGFEHHDDVGAPHDDENVEIAADSLFKPQKLELNALLVAAFFGFFILFARPLVPAAARGIEGFVTHPAALRPPLRGPPLTARA